MNIALPKLYLNETQSLSKGLELLCMKYSIEVEVSTEIPEMCFVLNNERLSFQQDRDTQINFDLSKTFYKILIQSRKNALGPLYKAVGKETKTIIDTTCGTGADSMYFLAMGLEVYAYERNPMVAFLIEEAITFYKNIDDDFSIELNKFHFVFADASKLDVLPNSDAIYYDPMFPEKRKSSAKSKKEMEVFKAVVGEDLDELDVLKKFLENKKIRVIVKRPSNAEPILKKPTASFEGKTTRYDLYKEFLV